MATPLIMPKLGLTMEEGTIVRWLKEDGSPVEKGEAVLEIMTDKASMEVEAPDSGLLHILRQEGEVVPILEAIAQILQPGESALVAPVAATGSPAGAPSAAPAQEAGPAALSASVPTAVSGVAPAAGRLRISPAARRVARELALPPDELARIPGTGPGGRIVQEDVRRFAAARSAGAAHRASEAQPLAVAEGAEVIPLTGIRAIIAERMTRSVREAPQFNVSIDIAMDGLAALRQELQPKLEAAFRVRLSYTDLLVKAVARTLTEFRLLNAFVGEREVVLQPQVNLGVAVGAERGLVVPVVRDAAGRSLAEVAADLKRLVAGARTGSLSLDDLSGGTFTLSNLGMFGVKSFTAIVNPPQAAILAVGATREELRPAGRGIEVRPVATFTLTCDHRAVDGLIAAQFLARLKSLIEGPELSEVCAF